MQPKVLRLGEQNPFTAVSVTRRGQPSRQRCLASFSRCNLVLDPFFEPQRVLFRHFFPDPAITFSRPPTHEARRQPCRSPLIQTFDEVVGLGYTPYTRLGNTDDSIFRSLFPLEEHCITEVLEDIVLRNPAAEVRGPPEVNHMNTP